MKLFLNELSLNSIRCRKTFLGGGWHQVPLSAVSLNSNIMIQSLAFYLYTNLWIYSNNNVVLNYILACFFSSFLFLYPNIWIYCLVITLLFAVTGLVFDLNFNLMFASVPPGNWSYFGWSDQQSMS